MSVQHRRIVSGRATLTHNATGISLTENKVRFWHIGIGRRWDSVLGDLNKVKNKKTRVGRVNYKC